jgi:cation:H+ antiporter
MRRLWPLFGAILLTLPWLAIYTSGGHPTPPLIALLTGVSILGAAFLLSWAAELLQMDVSQALALALLALIAVLPEYAVDAVFAYQAGQDPVVAQQGYAVANMTGANRLLIGVGWSMVVIVAWLKRGMKVVVLERGQAVEMAILLLATVYALFMPFKGELNLVDTVVLLALFGTYTWLSARAPAEEPHLAGPAAVIGDLAVLTRRLITLALFVFAALVIFAAAEPFAHSLVQTGQSAGVDEFLLIQWLAPLASESPEFIVALLFVWRGQAAAGMRTLISSKVNQWTLLIATLPLVFSMGAGQLGGMPLNNRQQHELWLTAAQSLFAVALIAAFRINRWEAFALLIPFLVQLALPAMIGPVDVKMVFTLGYLIAGIVILCTRERRTAVRGWPRDIAATTSPHVAGADPSHA